MTEENKWRVTDAVTGWIITIVGCLFIIYKKNGWFPNTKSDRVELTVLDRDTIVSTESFLCGKDVAKWVCQLKSVYLTNPAKIDIKTTGAITYGTLWLLVHNQNKVTDMNGDLTITEADSKVLYEIWENLKDKKSRGEVDLKSYEQ